jgi:hypothetical protein
VRIYHCDNAWLGGTDAPLTVTIVIPARSHVTLLPRAKQMVPPKAAPLPNPSQSAKADPNVVPRRSESRRKVRPRQDARKTERSVGFIDESDATQRLPVSRPNSYITNTSTIVSDVHHARGSQGKLQPAINRTEPGRTRSCQPRNGRTPHRDDDQADRRQRGVKQ